MLRTPFELLRKYGFTGAVEAAKTYQIANVELYGIPDEDTFYALLVQKRKIEEYLKMLNSDTPQKQKKLKNAEYMI